MTSVLHANFKRSLILGDCWCRRLGLELIVHQRSVITVTLSPLKGYTSTITRIAEGSRKSARSNAAILVFIREPSPDVASCRHASNIVGADHARGARSKPNALGRC